MKEKSVREWKEDIQPVLKSKVNEFNTLGYQDVTVSEIWECLEKQVWKGNPKKRIHEVIQDVFHLQPGTYINHIRIGALRSDKDDLMSSIHAVTGNDEE